MKPLFLCPGDIVKLTEDGQISSTVFLLSTTPEAQLDEPQKFLMACSNLPKGTVLEVSQIYIKNRSHPDNAITFKVIEGPMFSSYNKSMLSTEMEDLQNSIDALQQKLKGFLTSSPERTEIVYNVKNRQKRLDALKKTKTKKGFTKLIRISLTDIETWEVKPSSV